MISKKLAIDILNIGLSTGADYAEIYCQNQYSHITSLAKKKIDNVFGKLTYGVGIRLLKGTDEVYGYTSDISKKSLVDLVNKLSSSFNGERVKEVKTLNLLKQNHKNDPLKPHDSMSIEEKLEVLRKAEKVGYDYSKKVVDVRVGLNELDEEVCVFNSDEVMVKENRVRTRIMGVVTASDGKSFQTGSFSPGESIGLEILDKHDLSKGILSAAKDAVDLLDAPECPSGEIPVIIGNAFGGTLFHEACGHPLEGSAISHNSSAFCGKLGQKIASPIVTAVDDGTIQNGWGSEGYDDEGIKSTKNVLIKDGILVNYMIDRLSGRKLGLTPTGSCRRQSYKFVPTTRMTNTYIAAGKSTKEEIIAATKLGLYLVDFNGGSVDPSTAKFNFTASKAYMVIDGKIDHLVKGACLVGYGYDVLMNIDMVGNDLVRAPGICGAASGNIPVEVGQPTLRVSKMIVGGRGGNI